jgi:hypothetical protein
MSSDPSTIHGRTRSRAPHQLRGRAFWATLQPSLGRWHSVAAIRKIAAWHGFDTTFYGSLLYPYRFHVRMVLCAR